LPNLQLVLSSKKDSLIKYGSSKTHEYEDPVNLVVHEWKNIGKDISKKGLTFRQRWNYLFGPPGWSHDGSTHTSNELRKMEKEGKL